MIELMNSWRNYVSEILPNPTTAWPGRSLEPPNSKGRAAYDGCCGECDTHPSAACADPGRAERARAAVNRYVPAGAASAEPRAKRHDVADADDAERRNSGPVAGPGDRRAEQRRARPPPAAAGRTGGLR